MIVLAQDVPGLELQRFEQLAASAVQLTALHCVRGAPMDPPLFPLVWERDDG